MTKEIQQSVENPQELRVRELFSDIGLDFEKIKSDIVHRIELLDRVTGTIDDARRMIKMARMVFNYYNDKKPQQAFSEDEKKEVTIGETLSDIGKSGPRNADKKMQEIIAEIYAVENIPDVNITLEDLIKDKFQADAPNRLEGLKSIGLDASMTMRDFWDMHAFWTLEIISGDGVPSEAIAAAATHHFIQGINPEGIVGANDRFTRKFGTNVAFDRAEKLVILLDKYDAFARRSGLSHSESIGKLKQVVAQNDRYKDDEEFATLIGDMDIVFGQKEL